jgi:hypothetical protein
MAIKRRISRRWKVPVGAPKLVGHIGPQSSLAALAKLDGRTREAMFMRRVHADLTRHVGGTPSAVERMLIERASVLMLRLAKLDEKIVNETGPLTLHDTNFIIAWQNSLTKVLVALGIAAAAAPTPTLDMVIAEISAAKAVRKATGTRRKRRDGQNGVEAISTARGQTVRPPASRVARSEAGAPQGGKAA